MHGLAGGFRVDASVTLDVDALDTEPGIRIRDTAEGEALTIATDRAVSPTTVDPDVLDAPVDTAVAVDATELLLPFHTDVIVRRNGDVVHNAVRDGDSGRLPRATYEIDISPPAVKLYVLVENGQPAVGYGDNSSYLDVGDADRVVIGLRSHQETPAGTVTVRDDPRDAMAAVSTFGSALKTLSPDRSWPTLRGHPPAVERGDDLDVPSEVEPPETGVRIEVPPEYGAIYSVAPLAYYLGATVESGDAPRLVADSACRAFDADGLAADVRSVLEHVFTLDVAVREAGVYPFRTNVSERLDDRVDLDDESLFEAPLAERTAAYLDVPRSATEGLLDWQYTADVAPNAANVVSLPFLLDELALVRSPPSSAESRTLTPQPNALRADGDGALARSTDASDPEPLEVTVPAAAGTPGQSWITTDLAPGAANPTLGSFRRALDWPAGEGPLDVHVVYNDARLDAGDDVAYDVHETAETDVRVSRSLTTSALRDALTEDTDFLHFVGHVTDDGMVCRDGELDVRTLATTGVSAFFLNGCRSYEQGRALLTAGSVGGLVTVDDVDDSKAGDVGRAVSMLLDAGFPLYAVLDALRLTGVEQERYAILGRGTLAFRRAASGIPMLYEFDGGYSDTGDDALSLTARYYPYGENGMGALVSPMYTDGDSLVGAAHTRTERIDRADVADWLAAASIPMVLDGTIRHAGSLSPADFE